LAQACFVLLSFRRLSGVKSKLSMGVAISTAGGSDG
jgi:hypothetical protein